MKNLTPSKNAFLDHIFMTTDCFFATESIKALIERGFVNPDELAERNFAIGEINILYNKDNMTLVAFIKNHINDKVLRTDIVKMLKILKKLITTKNITSIGLIKDLAILSSSEWLYLVDQFDKIFYRSPLIGVLFFFFFSK